MDSRYVPDQGQAGGTRPLDVTNGNTMSDTIHDAHRLLSAYPFASTTSSTHIAHHLSNMSISAAPPSYMHPEYYQRGYNHGAGLHQQPSNTYATEIQYLSSQHEPQNDNGYWRNTRNEAVRLLGGPGSLGTHIQHQSPALYSQHSSIASSYQPSSFAHSVLQQSTHTATYPTPPPVTNSFSSSSLALALVEPPKQKKATYHADQSAQFFNDFKGQHLPNRNTTMSGSVAADSSPSHQYVPPGPPHSQNSSYLPHVPRSQASFQQSAPLPPVSSFTTPPQPLPVPFTTPAPSHSLQQSHTSALPPNTTQPNSYSQYHYPSHSAPQPSYYSPRALAPYEQPPQFPRAPSTSSRHPQEHHIPHLPPLVVPNSNTSFPAKSFYSNEASVPHSAVQSTAPSAQRPPESSSKPNLRASDNVPQAVQHQPTKATPQSRVVPPPLPALQHSPDRTQTRSPPPSFLESTSSTASYLSSNTGSGQAVSQPSSMPATLPASLPTRPKHNAPIPAKSFYSNAPPPRKPAKTRGAAPVTTSAARSASRQPTQTLKSDASTPAINFYSNTLPPPHVPVQPSTGQPSPATVQVAPLDVQEQATATPRKRKAEAVLESPSKRTQLALPGRSRAPLSGSSSSSHGTIPDDSSDVSTPSSVFMERTLSTSAKEQNKPTLASRQSSVYVELPTLEQVLRAPSTSTDTESQVRVGRVNWDTVASSPMKEDFATPSERMPVNFKGPLAKLSAIFDDIFEAEDALPPGPSLEDLPSEMFSSLTTNFSQPLLHPAVIRKMVKYISLASRNKRNGRVKSHDVISSNLHTVGNMSDFEPSVLSRVLKILERTVRAGEHLDPFKYEDALLLENSTQVENASPTKGAKKTKVKNKLDGGANPQMDEVTQISEDEHASFSHLLELARDSVLAAEACLALLCSDRLAKHLYSEDLISVCLGTIKNQLAHILYPFIEASLGSPISSILQHIVQAIPDPTAKAHRGQIADIFQALSAALPRVTAMVYADSVAMSDTLVIQAVYIAIGPFFVVEGQTDQAGKGKKDTIVTSTLGASAIRGLRLDALTLIRSIFANYEDQRSWIIEEILMSLTKLSDSKLKAGQFRLRDGRSIRTVSALLLQLVQTSAHDVYTQARRLNKIKQQQLVLRRQESTTRESDELLDDQDHAELNLYADGLKSATGTARMVVTFLAQRSGKAKATKNSNETEHRAIFDNLVSDVMTVLFLPDWPAASILLDVIYRFMVTSLEDVKLVSQGENSAAKALALDHLGSIAARIRTMTMKFRSDDGEAENAQENALVSLSEIVNKADVTRFQQLQNAQRDLLNYLIKQSADDQAFDSARELCSAMWGQELAHSLKRINVHLHNTESDNKITAGASSLTLLAAQLKTALRAMWKEHQTDVFNTGSQEEASRVEALAEELGVLHNFHQMLPRVLRVVIAALDAPPVFMRTKALRALGAIVTSDPSVLSLPNVRNAIETHLLDSSPAVRDAAVELIGKYMLESTAVAADYYRQISDRMADTGLGVRKRVIKLLRNFYDSVEDIERRIDICNKIALRMFDEDDTVKDLAIKSIEEMWFPCEFPLQKTPSQSLHSGAQDQEKLRQNVAIIMGVCAYFKDRQSPLEDMLHSIMIEKSNADAAVLTKQYTDICELLIDGLVDDADIHGFSIVNCIRTIHLFSVAFPAVLSASKASILLPYIKHVNGLDEQVTSEYLLKIFKACVPHMPKTAAKFGQDLQQVLQPLILKPPNGLPGLQESVACMCTVVQHLTHDYNRLVALLKSCDARLQQYIKKPTTTTNTDLRPQSMLIFIVSLLGKHCDFDHLRSTQPALAPDLDAISHLPIVEHLYNTLLGMYAKYSDQAFKGRVLHCLGFIFHAKPTLMTAENSTSLMDKIMSSDDVEMKGRLLKLIQEFLLAQLSQYAEKQRTEKGGIKNSVKALKMDELIGNADDFADTGVSLSIVQRYLEQVFEAAQSQLPQIQSPAVDILSFTVRQGMTNPLQCLPTIVALETCPSPQISLRASALHTFAHSKHGDQLTPWTLPALKGSFEYQKQLDGTNIRGLRMAPGPIALLHHWYTLVRDKRSTRQEFLSHFCKALELKSDLTATQEDIDFIRYAAENLGTFEYKTQEEVLTVIYHLTKKLSTAGTQVIETILPSSLMAQLHGNPDAMQTDKGPEMALDAILPTARASVLVGILAILRAHLQVLYSLNDEKCHKWIFGKKSVLGDKAATRKHEEPISWERLTYAKAAILTSEDMQTHRTQLLEVWNDHKVIPSADEDG